MTHPHPDSAESVKPFGFAPSARAGVVRFLGYLTASVGLISAIWLPYGLITIKTGAWLGPGDGHPRPVIMGLWLVFEFFVALLALSSGIAAGARKIWSRFGMMLYAIISVVLALIGILPVVVYLVQGKADLGFQHALIMLVIIKQWVIELPLALAILYTFSKKTISEVYAAPVIESPDRSQR